MAYRKPNNPLYGAVKGHFLVGNRMLFIILSEVVGGPIGLRYQILY